METKILAIKEKVQTRPTRFYSPELKKEILEICGELQDLGWSRKRIQSALGVGYQSIDAWEKPKIKTQRVQLRCSLQLISPGGWRVQGLDLAELKQLLS